MRRASTLQPQSRSRRRRGPARTATTPSSRDLPGSGRHTSVTGQADGRPGVREILRSASSARAAYRLQMIGTQLGSLQPVPHTTVSSSAPVPQTTVSSSMEVPHTTVSSSVEVPHTTVSSPDEVPHTTVSSPEVPQTTVSPSLAPQAASPLAVAVNTRMSQGPSQLLLPHLDPQTRFGKSGSMVHAVAQSSQVELAHRRPNWIGWPSRVVLLPHVAPELQAFAAAVSHPPVTSRLPQIIRPLQSGENRGMPAAMSRARSTAPFAFRNPAPSVSGSWRGYTCAVNCRIAFTAVGVSDGFACSISATVPLTTGAAKLVPLRLK